MNKTIGIILTVFITAVVIGGVVFFLQEQRYRPTRTNQNTNQLTNVNQTAETNTNTIEVVQRIVYYPNREQDPDFTQCNSVFPVQRTIPIAPSATTSDMLKATLQALFAGPTVQEAAAGYASLFSKDTQGILKDVFITDHTAYINLTDIRTVIPNASTSCGGADFFAEVETTVKQFSGITRIIYAIDNTPQTFYEWIQIGCGTENDFCDASPFGGSAAVTRSVNVYVVNLEDTGQHGNTIGCGDSVVPLAKIVTADSKKIEDAIAAAVDALLSIPTQTVEHDYYNALYQSHLTVDSVTLNGAVAHVALSGTYALGGVCDNPRFETQLVHTVTQFPEVETADITVNGKSLREILSLQ